MEGWVWKEGEGREGGVLCAHIGDSSQEGAETPRVKVRRNLMIGSFCQASMGFSKQTAEMIGHNIIVLPTECVTDPP